VTTAFAPTNACVPSEAITVALAITATSSPMLSGRNS
jgi:hypothetical protein